MWVSRALTRLGQPKHQGLGAPSHRGSLKGKKIKLSSFFTLVFYVVYFCCYCIHVLTIHIFTSFVLQSCPVCRPNVVYFMLNKIKFSSSRIIIILNHFSLLKFTTHVPDSLILEGNFAVDDFIEFIFLSKSMIYGLLVTLKHL